MPKRAANAQLAPRSDVTSSELSALWSSVHVERRELRELRSSVQQISQKIESIRNTIVSHRQSELFSMIAANRVKIETLEHRLQLEQEAHKRLQQMATELSAFDSEDSEIAALEERLDAVESERMSEEYRYAAITLRQDRETAEIEEIICRMVPAERPTRRRLLVGLFPYRIATRKVRSLFARFGRIESVEVVVAKAMPRRYVGQIQFVRPEDAENALAQMQNTQFTHGPLLVKWAARQPDMEATDSRQSSQMPESTESGLAGESAGD
jgi:hypothetical protein